MFSDRLKSNLQNVPKFRSYGFDDDDDDQDDENDIYDAKYNTNDENNNNDWDKQYHELKLYRVKIKVEEKSI